MGRGGLEWQDAFHRLANVFFAQPEGDSVFFSRRSPVQREAELIQEKFLEDEALLRRRAIGVERFDRFAGRRKMRMGDGLAPRREAESRAQFFRQDFRHARIDELQRGVNRAANRARAESADGFVDGHDAADFGGIGFALAEHFHLRIDHFEARGPQLVDFGFSVENEPLAGL